MGVLSPILRSIAGGGLAFFCPGCTIVHLIFVGIGPGPRWGWNGDAVRPTFYPSIHLTVPQDITDEQVVEMMRGAKLSRPHDTCHSGVLNGMIHYFPDSTHRYAGQTVALPPWTTA
jgi:hypothetical protein